MYFQATDDDGKGQTSSVPLKVSLTDSNDNPPVFGQSTYRIYVNEGATRFEPPQVIDARDEDKTSQVTYAIVAGNDEELFKIDSETGKLKITGSKGLDVSNDTDNVVTLTVLVRFLLVKVIHFFTEWLTNCRLLTVNIQQHV